MLVKAALLKSVRSTAWNAMAVEYEFYHCVIPVTYNILSSRLIIQNLTKQNWSLLNVGILHSTQKLNFYPPMFISGNKTIGKSPDFGTTNWPIYTNILLFKNCTSQLHLIRAFSSCYLSYCIAAKVQKLNRRLLLGLAWGNQQTRLPVCLQKTDQLFPFAVLLWVNRHWYTC